MSRARCFIFLLLSLPGLHSVHAQVADSVTTHAKGQTGMLVSLYQAMLDGVVRSDTVALRSVLSPTYTWTPGDEGVVYTRSQRFAHMMLPGGQPDSLYVHYCRVASYRGSAVGNCRVGQRGDFGSGPRHSEVLATVVFVKEAAGWRIASTHTLVIPDSLHSHH